MSQDGAVQRMTLPVALSLLLLTASANDSQVDGVLGACTADLHEQRFIYESKLASLRQQLESAHQETREARTQLESLRATCCAQCPRVVDQDAGVVTGPPSNQSVHDGADGLGRGLRLPGSTSSWPVAENTQPVAENAVSSSLDRVSSPRPQNKRGVVGRSLLQSEGRACSKAEAQAVLSAAADPIPVVMQMMGTNPSCATCIISRCVEAKGADSVMCLQSCQHQQENRCDESTGLQRLAPLLSNVSLDDRDSLVRLLLLAESDCTRPRSPHRPLRLPESPIHRARVYIHALMTHPFAGQVARCTPSMRMHMDRTRPNPLSSASAH